MWKAATLSKTGSLYEETCANYCIPDNIIWFPLGIDSLKDYIIVSTLIIISIITMISGFTCQP